MKTILDMWHRVVASPLLRVLVLSGLREMARRHSEPEERGAVEGAIDALEALWR